MPKLKSVHVVPGALWRIVGKLMEARIDRDTDLHTLLITAREAGKALLANAEHNDRLRERFKVAYGEDIKEYFGKCMGEVAKDGDYDADYAEYLCWYSLLLRVFMILTAPTEQEKQQQQYEEAEEEAEEVGE